MRRQLELSAALVFSPLRRYAIRGKVWGLFTVDAESLDPRLRTFTHNVSQQLRSNFGVSAHRSRLAAPGVGEGPIQLVITSYRLQGILQSDELSIKSLRNLQAYSLTRPGRPQGKHPLSTLQNAVLAFVAGPKALSGASALVCFIT